MSLRGIFRALQYRNFRLFFIGQIISLTGTWMQLVAVSWLVFRMTNSAFWLGMTGFISQAPSLLLTPFAGVLVDRWNRHRIIVVCQILAMAQAVVFAMLIFFGKIVLWQIIALGACLGLIGSIEIPARHAFLVAMVEKKEDLGNAIALNSFMFNAARFIGPSVAGIMIGFWGEGICFLLNSASYVAVIAALLMMRNIPQNNHIDPGDPFEKLKEGIRYTFGSPAIRSVLLLIGLVSMFGMVKAVLMPVFAKNILQGGAHTLGFLMSSTGCGALTGAVYLASRKDPRMLINIIPAAVLIFGAALIIFSFSTVFWLSMAMLFFAGFGLMANMVASNTVLQTIVDDDKRGRVMSFYTLAFMGMATVGNMAGGSLGTVIGAPKTLRLVGILSLCVSMLFFRYRRFLKNSISAHNAAPVYETRD
jgi:MFS family permease